MKNLPQWVLWRIEAEEKTGKPTKVPYQAKSRWKASHSKPDTWSEFHQVATRHLGGNYAGIGFVFASGGGLCGIDLDGCRNPATAEIADWSKPILEKFSNTYAEVSPSATGIKIFAGGVLPTKLSGARSRSPATIAGWKPIRTRDSFA